MKLIFPDYLAIFSILLILVAHVSSNFIFSLHTTTAEKQVNIEKVVDTMETNPIARYFFRTQQLRFMFSFVIAPSLLAGMYYFLRKRYFDHPDILGAYAVAIFVVALMDASNDVSILLGILMR